MLHSSTVCFGHHLFRDEIVSKIIVTKWCVYFEMLAYSPYSLAKEKQWSLKMDFQSAKNKNDALRLWFGLKPLLNQSSNKELIS